MRPTRRLAPRGMDGTFRSDSTLGSRTRLGVAVRAASAVACATLCALLLPADSPGNPRSSEWMPGGDATYDATQTWLRGADFFAAGSEETRGAFLSIDARVRRYLLRKGFPRVPWPGQRHHADGMRDALYEALLSGESVRELHALVVLMRSHTSSCVAEQWRVLQAIVGRSASPRQDLGDLLRMLQAEFDSDRLRGVIECRLAGRCPGREALDDETLWAIGAVGATHAASAVGLLQECAASGDSDAQAAVVNALAELRDWAGWSALVGIARADRQPGRGMAITCWRLLRQRCYGGSCRSRLWTLACSYGSCSDLPGLGTVILFPRSVVDWLRWTPIAGAQLWMRLTVCHCVRRTEIFLGALLRGCRVVCARRSTR